MTDQEKAELKPSVIYCYSCYEKAVEGLTGIERFRVGPRFIVCPVCGNKRCPKSTHHDNDCSNSNLPGQKGSKF